MCFIRFRSLGIWLPNKWGRLGETANVYCTLSEMRRRAPDPSLT
jgi:hypothetical protein